jgi:hypothetical protein
MKFKGGEFSTGTMRNFQSELTQKPRKSLKIALEVACCGLDCGLKIFWQSGIRCIGPGN